jgi:CheY-like chemotaxis protein
VSNQEIVVYAEDDALSRDVMRIMMKHARPSTQLVIFEDSRDFMLRMKFLPNRPCMILLDIHLQPLDGFAVLDSVRADSSYRNTKVVALTASVMNEEIESLKKSGFDGAIGKPLNARIFPALLERLLAGHTVWHVS